MIPPKQHNSGPITRQQRGTNPLTIADALDLESSRRQKKDKPTTHPSPVVDILAVVERALVLHSSQQAPVGQVWIVDASIDTELTKALVCFYDRRTIQAISEAEIAPGDALRFNRVSLRRTTVKPASDSKFETANNGRTIQTHIFHHGWDNPEAGPSWFGLWGIHKTPEHHAAVIPESMTTDPGQLEELIRWFLCSPFYQKSTIHPLPCHRRTLEEIHASVGLTSNVIVTVCSVETLLNCRPSPARPSTRKRLRSASVHVNNHAVLAIVSDPHGRTRMSFVDSDRRWEGLLRDAYKSQQAILLNNVVCRNSRHIPAIQQQYADDCVVLVQSNSTSIVPLSNNDIRRQLPVSTQPFLTASQSQTQNTASCRLSTHAPQFSTSRKTLQLEECLHDIVIVDTDSGMNSLRAQLLGSECCISLTSFLSVLLDEKQRCYRRATLKIGRVSPLRGRLIVHAKSNLMQILCGGLEPGELSGKTTLQQLVCDLIRGLLEEPIQLSWTLEPKRGSTPEEYELVQVSINALR